MLLWPQLKCTAKALAKSFIFTALGFRLVEKINRIFKVFFEQETRSEKDSRDSLFASERIYMHLLLTFVSFIDNFIARG